MTTKLEELEIKPTYLLVGLIVLLVNNFLLPFGILYTTILTPVFLYWLCRLGRLKSLTLWTLLILLPIPAHLLVGVHLKYYLFSSLLMFSVWIFLFTAIEGLKIIGPSLEVIFRKALILNCLAVSFAIITLPIPSIRALLWNSIPITEGTMPMLRLQLFAYEPSHYALLFAPVALFFALRIIMGYAKSYILMILALIIPLVLSLSFGVIGALIISLTIGLFAYIKVLTANTKRIFIYGGVIISLGLIILGILWPDNIIFLRIENIFSGRDTSTKGRISESFMFAQILLKQHGALFGVGPGQIKVFAHNLIMDYYQYWYAPGYVTSVRIPNSMAETLAIYGIYGFTLKLLSEVVFFYITKVYKNLYSLTLFVFIFIYQFTGSFTTNVAEVAIWAIIFITRFPQFDFDNIREKASVKAL
jgi:hypothetical protein